MLASDAYSQASLDQNSNSRSADILSRRPVFVASSFRTSSTWLWLHLRSSPNTMAYCEIFNEMLAALNCRSAAQISASSWQSKHPHSAPYFVEFLPLLKEEGGVDGYLPDMALDRFIPPEGIDGDISREEHAYIALLIERARRCRKIPVLTCTRALGRSKALKRAFDFHMVVLYRNIFHQWASYSQQAMSGNNYFIDTIDKTLLASSKDPFLSKISNWFHNRKNTFDDVELFYSFLLMNIYLAAVGHDSADLTIDVTQIAADYQLNRETAEQLSQLVGSQVRLDDVKLDFGCVGLPTIRRSELIDLVQQFTKIMGDAAISESAHSFAEKAAEDALEEWERHEFFTRGLRSIQAQKLTDMNDALSVAKSEADKRLAQMGEEHAAAQRIATADTDQARNALETYRQAADEASERQRCELAAALAECRLLHEQVEHLTVERQAVAAGLEQASNAAASTEEAASEETPKQAPLSVE